MKKYIFYSITLIFLCSNLYALPKCPGEKHNLTTWKNCSGSYKAIDGHTYSGDFDGNGLYSGYGVLNTGKGSIYEGEFFKNKYHGQGKQTLLEGKKENAYYEGEWFMGNWNGQGKVWSKDGSFAYEGEFQNMEMTGYGILTYYNESVSGNWKNGSCNDQATCKAVKAIEKKYQ